MKDKQTIISGILERQKIVKYVPFFEKAMSVAMDAWNVELIAENERLRNLLSSLLEDLEKYKDMIANMRVTGKN